MAWLDRGNWVVQSCQVRLHGTEGVQSRRGIYVFDPSQGGGMAQPRWCAIMLHGPGSIICCEYLQAHLQFDVGMILTCISRTSAHSADMPSRSVGFAGAF